MSTPRTPSPASHWRSRLVRAHTATGWEGRRWTSAILEPDWGHGIAADQAVASWVLDQGTTALVEIGARTVDGSWRPWQAVASWGEPGERRSPKRSSCDGPVVETDVLTAATGEEFDAVRLRITLLSGVSGRHAVRLAAVSFSTPQAACAEDAAPVGGSGVVGTAATVRPLSQRAYPARADLGGGGPAWCSPTSLVMVASAWGARLPSAAAADVPDGTDGRVPWAAAAVYDAEYRGTGNWSFNTALAGELGFDAVVTRLSSLRSARILTEAGIPLVASISFAAGELPGADYETSGHLLVLLGFDDRGDVLVADPSNAGGQDGLRTYPRLAFDAAWEHSRRAVYLIVPRGHALPACGDGEW